MTAYDKLREQLYSDSFALEVLPRRRLFVSGTMLSVPGASVDVSGSFLTAGSPPIAFNGPGDGVLLEWAQLNFAPFSTSTVVCSDASISLGILPSTGFRSVVFGLRRSRPNEQAQITGALTVAEQFDLSPGLLSSLDLAGAGGKNTPSTSINQIPFAATFFESSAAAQNILWQAALFLRQVRGLQEN